MVVAYDMVVLSCRAFVFLTVSAILSVRAAKVFVHVILVVPPLPPCGIDTWFSW
ncbi:hypothetical protein PC129_g20387 [Phytophthora cactorum]|uniref:Uncharacterized protein n=1 Tax=Phytophthora cactorum TaxID=29920 RepID=A0A8T1H8R9_9STRA|nr:hypothetical protein Pcac1_g17030 [Phytophthora cactorum]KAG2817554.1 hypothetical protein PC111_g12671 [Phytophthora cactorum]KAG3208593.1 hypothetical protein PC129_g20387 [Phytophthora cactorum]